MLCITCGQKEKKRTVLGFSNFCYTLDCCYAFTNAINFPNGPTFLHFYTGVVFRYELWSFPTNVQSEYNTQVYAVFSSLFQKTTERSNANMMEWLAWIVPIWFFRVPQSCSRGVQMDWCATVYRHVPNTKSNWSDGRTREFENPLSNLANDWCNVPHGCL